MIIDDFIVKHPLMSWIIIGMMCATAVEIVETLIEPINTIAKEMAKNKSASKNDA
jgi:hypothetical protein